MFRAHGQIDSLALELRSTACRSISGPPIELTTYSTMSVRPHWAQDQGRTQWRPSTNGDHWSRCLVLSLDGAPIAVASAFMPRLHRSRAWCYVEVVPSARRAGIGTTELAALRAALPPASPPLRAKVPGQAHRGPAQFAALHGFVTIQRNRTIELDEPIAGSEPESP